MLAPWWSDIKSIQGRECSGHQIAAGVPLPVLRGGNLWLKKGQGTDTAVWGIPKPSRFFYIDDPKDRPHNSFVAVGAVYPTRIIWRGLIANTIFYTAIVWLLFALLAASRRALRRKRNKCEWCAYSLAGLDSATRCPECGCAVRRPAPSPLEGEGGREATG